MNDIKLWDSNAEAPVPASDDVSVVVSGAQQLRKNDQAQIVSAYQSGNYQMLSTYVWSKTITIIKSQLTKMGAAFVGEMLDRPDISDHTNLQQAITDFEAIQLAEDLGLLNGKSAFRLKHAMDLLSYFNNPDELDDEDSNDFNRVDALQVLQSCISGVLGHERIELRINFKTFRNELEEQTLSEDHEDVQKLLHSPIFFKRTTIKILLSIIKSKHGAHLENALNNSNLIIPRIWDDLKQPERWQVGRCYAELFTEGKSTAVSGLKQVLLKVKGFDYVPEDLRSTSFIKAANELIKAHEGANNYYYEATPTRILKEMGSTVPMPAFPTCMSAILSVRLGNYWGYAWDAQQYADAILSNVQPIRWQYYFDECLPNDNRILHKLTQQKPKARWVELIKGVDNILAMVENVRNLDVKALLKATSAGNMAAIEGYANRIKEKNASR